MGIKKIKAYPINYLLNGNVEVGSKVTVRGWVKTRRDSKGGFSFITLHDGSCFNPIQIIAANSLPNYQNEILHLTAGCSLIATGEIAVSLGKGQAFEIKADKIEVTGMVGDPEVYPISSKPHTLEYLREYAHLRPRTNVIGAITRVQNRAAQAIHRFFDNNGFYWLHTPIITTIDAEGAGAQFHITTFDLANVPKTPDNKIAFDQDFFGKETLLTVSGQLNAECYCEGMSKVYTFGPTFRAENSNTSRHLAEFWMVEPEIAFADLHDNIALAANMLKYICEMVLEKQADDMAFFVERIDKDCISRLEKIISSEFVTIEYTEAIKILEKSDKKFEFPIKWGHDLQSEHERYLTEEHIGRPIAVINYPKEIKSFYMRQNDDGKTVAAMDILAPGIGEIIGGSQREERFEKLDQRMTELKMNKELFKWYLDLRSYGTAPHSGFGLGFERLIGYITGMGNIRDVIPFPRASKHAEY
jgi:asparaginyl-tRNA synthetase